MRPGPNPARPHTFANMPALLLSVVIPVYNEESLIDALVARTVAALTLVTPDFEIICVDERLREKEFGILDGLTVSGIAATFPDQSEFRRLLGKFYHRPPGGESWVDVIPRLRSVLDTIALNYAERRVMIVAHQVVVLCLRYIIENLGEAEILAIDKAGDVAIAR